jgi:ligand-binding sensor domain-containing protein/DNA-binding CsgD family transcriptional regulator
VKAKVTKTNCLSLRQVFLPVLHLAMAVFMFTQENNICFDHISSNQGLSQIVVSCILQDRRGFMWFGTQSGLNRFDGYTFKKYKYNPKSASTLPANIVLCIYEDSSGNLWIGTDGGGLSLFDNEKETFIRCRYKNDADPNPGHDIKMISSIHEDRNGIFWIGTLGGLLRFNPQKQTWDRFVHKPGMPGTLSDSRIRTMCQDQRGIMWIGTEDGGLNSFDPKTGKFSRFLHQPDDADSICHNTVRAVFEDSSGNLWVGTFGGLDQFDGDTQKFIHYRHHPERKDSLSDNRVRAIFEDSKGRLWIGTIGGGLNLLKSLSEKTFVSYRHQPHNPRSLGSNKVISIMEDQIGCIWIGTYDGINRIDPQMQQFVHILSDSGHVNSLSSNYISCFYQDKERNLWIGTYDCGLNRYNPNTGEFRLYRHSGGDPQSLSSDTVRALHEDKNGDLWIGTWGGGINRFNRDTEKFSRYTYLEGSDEGPGSNQIYCFCQDQENNLWIGTWKGGLNLFLPEKNKFVYYKNEPRNPKSITGNGVTFIYPDREHEEFLWVGMCYSGLERFNRHTGNFKHYLHDPDDHNSVSSGSVLSIYISPHYSEIVWVGTLGGGLNKFNKRTKTWQVYTETDNLSDNTILGILEDKNGNLWLSTHRGLSRFNPEKEEFANYYAEDGLQDNEFNQGAFHKGRDGRFYFGGINGFNVFSPENIKKTLYTPPVVITDFKVLNRDFPLEKSILATETITLSYKDVFSFQFAALNYTSPGKNRYAYQLVGFIDEWIQLEHERKVVFSTLPPGKYVLRVKGSNNDGIWNEEGTSIKIIITPPFYSTWWFRGLVLLFPVVIAYLWHQSRMKRLTLRLKTEKEMERIVEKYNISPREQEILNLIMKGKSNKEIEDALFISMPTVKTHISNIYKKFAVKNRLELIRLIQQSIGAN